LPLTPFGHGGCKLLAGVFPVFFDATWYYAHSLIPAGKPAWGSDMVVRFAKRVVRAIKRLFPLHPLHVALFAFICIVFDRIALYNDPSFLSTLPGWVIDSYSIFFIVCSIAYAGFAVLKTVENLYGFQLTSPGATYPLKAIIDRVLSPAPFSPIQTVSTAVLSYLITIYAFAMIYESMGKGAATQFNVTLDLTSSIYFSIATIATVGYGDIVATTSHSRQLVSVEILFGVAYQIFFFSIIAGLIKRETTKPPADDYAW
jgi:Ion channel